MTPEQIDLEFEHMLIDKELRDKAEGKQTYVDSEYDDYDKETDSADSKLSDIPNQQEENEDDDWEDVE